MKNTLISPRSIAAIGAGLLCALIVAISSRPFLEHQPLYDELLHVFAARGILDTGDPVIADGEYQRAELYSRAAAAVQRLRGVGPEELDLIGTRLPAWLCAIALVFIMAVWVSIRAGLLAGVLSGLLLAFSPLTIELSVFARFYTMNALGIAILVIAVYEGIWKVRFDVGRAALFLVAAAGFALALAVQITAVIGLGACATAAVLGLAVDPSTGLNRWVRAQPLVALGLAAALAACAALVGATLGLFDIFNQSVLWSAADANKPNYYNRTLSALHPFLWPLIPVAAAVAAIAHRRLATYLVIFSLVAILVHSFAAQKTTRYVYYAMPFVWALLGVGIADAMRWVYATLRERASWLNALLVCIVPAGLAAGMSQEGQAAAKLLLGRMQPEKVLSYAEEADWTPARAMLLDEARDVEAVIVSNAMKGLYYLGDYSYELNASTVSEKELRKEFSRDSRTGRPAISKADSLARVLDLHRPALVVIETEKLGVASGVSVDVVDLIKSRCALVGLPPETLGLAAWRCPGR